MSWDSDRNIEEEIQNERQLRQNDQQTWEPWGPLDWPDDYGVFEFYADRLKSQSKYSGVRILRAARTALLRFRDETNVIDNITDLGSYQAEKFADWLIDEREVSKETRDKYISRLNKMGEFYSKHDYFNGNPFSDVEKTTSSNSSTGFLESNRVEIPKSTIINKIRDYGIKNTTTVMIVTLAKTGIRLSELCNLTDKDLNIDNLVGEKFLDPRPELKDKPDTLYVDSNIEKGAISGDTNGNKRKVDTEIPIDSELKQLLTWYLIARPANFSSDPLFRSNKREMGSQLTTSGGGHHIINWSKEVGLHGNDDQMDNVTAHWFRSFFTTEMFMNTNVEELNGMSIEKFVKGLRGDVGDDVLDEYLQGSGDYRDAVVSNTPKFGIQLRIENQ